MDTPGQNPWNPCYCIALRRAANRITEYYDQLLRPCGITINQFSILATLSAMDGCGTGTLARRLQLEKSTLVRTLQPLLKAGYIEDSAPEGSRARELHLTPAGRTILADAKPVWKEAQTGIVGKLGTDNAEALMGMFRELERK